MSTTPLVKIDLVELFDKIVDGPSREELFDSLRLHNLRETLVVFVLQHKQLRGTMIEPTAIEARVMSISPEDGSTNRWLVELRVVRILNSDTESTSSTLPIYFDTQRRKGQILPPRRREVVVRDGQIVLDGAVIGNLPTATFS